MKEKLCAIKNALTKKNKSRYGLLLSVVALIEVLMILLVSTYSWVETISSIEITNTIGKIDTYTYTNAEIGTGSGYSGTPIDLERYFRASGNVHLATASSADGDNFFFPKVANAGANSNSYRKGTINDKNTNYIRFSCRVQAKGTNANFYFDKVPTFKIGGTEVTDNSVRLAISISDSVDSEGSTSVYSYNAVDSENVVGDVDGSKVATTKIHAFSDYDNNGEDAGNILFTVPKGGEKIITFTLWLQDSGDPEKNAEFSGKTVSSDDFKIVTGVRTTKINFVDRTSTYNTEDTTTNKWHWIGNDDAKMWVYAPSGNAYEMTRAVDENNVEVDPPTWSLTVASELLGDANRDFYFYRTANTVTSAPQNNYYNFWKTTLSSAGTTAIPTYTAFGNTKSGSVEGFGTWSDVAEIKVLGDNAENVLKTPGATDTPQELTINTAAAGISVEMNYNNNFWRAYVPNDSNSRNLTLKIKKNDTTTYTIAAGNRDLTESASTYRVTSSSTGYWEEPAIVEAIIPADYESMGTVSASGGPSGATTVKVTKGTTVKLTATPASDDYSFEGWYSDAECTKLVSSISQYNCTASEKNKTYTYYAKFQFNVRLTAKTDGVAEDASGGQVQINDDGTPGAKVSLPVQKGGSVKLIALPNTEDYEFMGWYDSESKLVYNNTQTTVEITDLQKPINLYAVYNVKKFVLKAYAATNGDPGDSGNATGGTVKFDSQTSSGAYAIVEVDYTDKATFVAIVKDTDGYEFAGWYSDAACSSSKLVTTELTYTVYKNTEYRILYAKFVLKKYNASAVAVTNGTEGSATGGTVQITADGVTTAAGESVTTNVTHGTTATFTATNKTGYKFVGWYDNASGGNLVSISPTYDATGVAGDIKLYAIFKQKFTVSLTTRTDGSISPAGGTVQAGASTEGSTSSATVLYGENITIKAIVSSAKYSFIGWFDSSNAEQGSEATKTLTSVKSNTTLCADFKVKTFTITAIAVSEGTQGSAGGTVEFTSPVASSVATATVTVTYDGSATFKATVNETDGYEFKGWFDNSDLSGTAAYTTSEFTLSNITDSTVKTYYAKFDLKQYTVTATSVTTGTATSGGGTVVQVVDGTEKTASDVVAINNVKHGSQITLRAKPASGATFLGWYDAETDGNQLADENTTDLVLTVTDNTQVYARFRVSGKTIYFKPNDGWKADSARFAAYMWTGSGGSGSENWYDLTDEDGDGTYCFTSTNSWSNIIFARMDPEKTANNWTNKWSQTGNLNVPEGDNPCYTITDGPDGSNNSTGTWGTYTPIEYVSVNLGAVSINSSGVTQSNGFTGGSITVGSNRYTAATVLKYEKDSSFSATATATGNYQFKGWYDNADCSGNALSTGTLSATLNENKTYYAKFVEQPNPNITITFIDNTTNYWASEQGKVYLKDNNTGTVYNSEEDGYSSNHQATFTVPSTVTDITFYRYQNGYGTSALWSTINAGSRGTKTKYAIVSEAWDKPISGNWQ